jgi:anti-sigma regulatory factor (Ser/Thr protein kinase)
VAETIAHALPHDHDAPAHARRIARDVALDRLPPERAEDLELMVSEIVTNAVRHAPALQGGVVNLRFQIEDHLLRTIVEDGGRDFRFETATFDTMVGDPHLGLQLVDLLSDAWGLSLDGKKAVWFEIDLSDRGAP